MKIVKKPVAVLVENGRSMGMNLSQLNEKGNGRKKKKKKKSGGGAGVKPSLKMVIKEDKLLTTKYDDL